MPKISICTICLNAETEILRTVESILNQNTDDYELIIKDGLSTDNTLKLLETIQKKHYNNCIKIVSEKDTGIYSAMNQAIKYACGEYCIFINSGDILHDTNVFEKALTLLNGTNDVVYGNCVMQMNDYKGLWEGNLNVIQKKMPFAHPACFVKTALLKELQFDESLRISADYDLILHLYSEGRSFAKLNYIISDFALNGLSSTKYYLRMKELYVVRCKNGLISKNYKSTLGYKYNIAREIGKEIINQFFPSKLVSLLKLFYFKHKYKKYK